MISKSFRLLLVILNEDAQNEMQHWDVKMAFTKAAVDEELYMYQPEGFEKKSVDGKLLVCKLKKALYGLKQSARNWQQLVRQVFGESGFVFFIREGGAWCLAGVHVDDIFPLFNVQGKKFRDRLSQQFQKHVEIESLGEIAWALKTLIQRDRKAGILKISQEQFTRDYLKTTQFENKTSSIPFAASGEDSNMEESDSLDEELKNFKLPK